MQNILENDTGSPQSILAALLADFSWESVSVPLPSAIFVKLLEVFEIDAASARVALDRVCKKGLLDRLEPEGRLTQYRLSKSAAQRRLRSVDHLMHIGEQLEPWDRTWTLLITSVPESRKVVRAKLRTQLLALGFARQYDAVWVKPNRSSTSEAHAILKELQIDQGSVFSAEHIHQNGSLGDPTAAFGLEEVQGVYLGFIRSFEKVARATTVRHTAADCLTLRIRLMDAWRSVVKQDPMLPNELLPKDFARSRAREVFLATYDALGPGAENCVRQVAAACGFADLPLHHFPSAGRRFTK